MPPHTAAPLAAFWASPRHTLRHTPRLRLTPHTRLACRLSQMQAPQYAMLVHRTFEGHRRRRLRVDEKQLFGRNNFNRMAGVEHVPGTRLLAVARRWDKCTVAVYVHRCSDDAARHLRAVVGQVVKSAATVVQTHPRLTITDQKAGTIHYETDEHARGNCRTLILFLTLTLTLIVALALALTRTLTLTLTRTRTLALT